MLGQINKPAPLPTLAAEKKYDAILKEANEPKIIREPTLTNSLRRVIRSTYNVEPTSHLSGIDFCSDMWSQFESLYEDTKFVERNTILIWWFSQTASDFNNIAQLIDSLKRVCTRLKKTGTKDLPD